MNYPLTKLIVGISLLFALGSFAVVEIVDPNKVLDWFIQFAATLVAVALAVMGSVWLFHYQDREAEEKREKRLATRVAMESQMNLWLLERNPSTFVDETQREVGHSVVLAKLSREAFTELIRSDLLEPEDAMRAMNYEGAIDAHNGQLEVLLSTRSSPLASQVFNQLSADLARRQANLKDDFRKMIQAVQNQGYDVPSYAEATSPSLRDEDGE